MRGALLASAALALSMAAPALAQDHSAHQHHDHAAEPAATAPDAMDHCAMGHLPPEQCPAGTGKPAQDMVGHDHAAQAQAQAPASPPQPHAAGHGAMDHSGHMMPAGKAAPDAAAQEAAPEIAVPPRALDGPRHAADAIWGAEAMRPSREENQRTHGGMATGVVMVERLEARIPADGGKAGWLWDAEAWHGGDIDRFVLVSEGEASGSGHIEDAEVQALWSHAIAPFFDLRAGLRLDVEPETRSHLVLGIKGLAPYMWHLDLAAFLSDRGDLTARFEAEHDQKITQRLILQPRVEVKLAARDIPERGLGAGLTGIEPGLRLRYEIVREFAPYVGVEYEAKTGKTADIARARGEDPAGWKALIGIRAWF